MDNDESFPGIAELKDSAAAAEARAALRQPAAWERLRPRLFEAAHAPVPAVSWGWVGAAVAGATAVLVLAASLREPEPMVQVATRGFAPRGEVWATAFYDREAGVDVVWLSGLDSTGVLRSFDGHPITE